MHTRLLSSLALAGMTLGLAACNGGSSPAAPTKPPTTEYTQFELLSRPAVKELFETFVNHQVTNGAEPYNDPTLSGSITTFTNAFRAPAYGLALQSILYPNELAADLSQTTPASYLGIETGGATSTTGSKFGGRDLADNVIDISLGAVFGNTLTALKVVATDDGQENNCLTTQNLTQRSSQANTGSFPYLSPPH
jgi:hypothetical protein